MIRPLFVTVMVLAFGFLSVLVIASVYDAIEANARARKANEPEVVRQVTLYQNGTPVRQWHTELPVRYNAGVVYWGASDKLVAVQGDVVVEPVKGD